MNRHQLSLVLEPIYRSHFSPDGWTSAAIQLALHIAGGSAAFFFTGTEERIAAGVLDPDCSDARACFLAADEGRPFLRVEAASHGGALRGSYVLKRTSGAGLGAGVVILEDPGKRLDETAAHRLHEIAPHLDLALTTGFDLADAQDRLVLGVLDTLGLPAATLDHVGTVVALNARFCDARFPWGGVEGQPLAIRSARSQARFAQLLAEDSSTVRSILLRSNGVEPPHSLHLLPLPEAGRAGLARSSMLLIGSPVEGPSADMIGSVFALSPVEAQLAGSILSGHSMDEIANSNGRSIHTVRNQLKAVLAKTGAHSQTQLAGLVARLLPLWG